MRISIIGSGHVGLVTGACFAELGNSVVCVDNDERKIKILKKGEVPFYEPGLEEMVRANMEEGRLEFTSSISEGIRKAKVVFICVGTPALPSGKVDLSAVEKVSKSIGESLTEYKVIVEKSTVPVKTGEKVERILRRTVKNRVKFDVASNPEFLREGSAIKDFLQPDRIIIGVSSRKASSILVELYEPLSAPILITDIKSAELIKHASNAFLAMKISFINAVANLCDLAGADIKKVAKGVGLDKRIGESFFEAGVGYGGSCFPKDVSAFLHIANELGYDFTLLKEVEKINHYQRERVIKDLEEFLGKLEGKTIGILGLSFKPFTDDIRESPAIDIVKMLKERGTKIKAHDPQAMNTFSSLFSDIEYLSDPYEVARGSDALVILTSWPQYHHLNLKKIKELLAFPLIVDGRNILDPAKASNAGLYYSSIGRGKFSQGVTP